MRGLPLLALVVTNLSIAANAAPLSVNIGDSSCNDSTGTPYCSIQAAITAASAGDTIQIAAGTYVNQHLTSYVVTFTKNLTLIGAGVDQTIIDGQDAFGGISVTSLVTAQVSGLTIKRGKATNGAGINNIGTLTLSDCAIRDNIASAGGGGISSGIPSTGITTNATLTVNRCTFDNNQSKGNGGLGNSFIYSYGGGAVDALGQLTITDSTFTNNSAVEIGGAIVLFKSNFPSAASIQNSTFNNNRSTYSGGAIATQGNLTLLSSTLNSNAALYGSSSHVGGGSGIYADSNGTVVIGNSTFNANSASVIFNDYANTTIYSTTIDQAYNSGRPIVNGASAQLRIKNSILAHAVDPNIPIVMSDCTGTITSLGYNLITDASSCTITATAGDLFGTDAAPLAAKLDVLADHGGLTATQAPFSDSATIDAGDPSGCTNEISAALNFDQRGQARASDDNNDGVVRCNMGAFEGALTVASSTPGSTAGGTTSGSTATASSSSSGGGGAFDLVLAVIALLPTRRKRRRQN